MQNRYLVATIAFLLSFTSSLPALSSDVQTLKLSDESVAHVQISLSGTVLSFPVKPTKVILGRSGTYAIDYVENDLAISPLAPGARSHLFVYLYGRRFSFDLSVSGIEGGSVILVRDAVAVSLPARASTPAPIAAPKKQSSLPVKSR